MACGLGATAEQPSGRGTLAERPGRFRGPGRLEEGQPERRRPGPDTHTTRKPAAPAAAVGRDPRARRAREPGRRDSLSAAATRRGRGGGQRAGRGRAISRAKSRPRGQRQRKENGVAGARASVAAAAAGGLARRQDRGLAGGCEIGRAHV